MPPFKGYLIGAFVFAVLATVACAVIEPLRAYVSDSAFVVLPMLIAFVIGGFSRSAGSFPYFVFFLQWFIIGLAFAVVFWALTPEKKDKDPT